MKEPIDKKLYNSIKQKIKNRVAVWPSAYASGQLVMEYKRAGGRYAGEKEGTALGRWYKEDWRNVCKKTKKGDYVKCGRKKSTMRNYPYCRPRVRVTVDTPMRIRELGSRRIKTMCKKKRASMRKSKGKQTRVRINVKNRKGGSGKGGLPAGTKFKRGSGRYKYTVVIPQENGRMKTVHFGHRDYQHYRDSVPKRMGGGIWSHKNHLDRKRRDNYRRRHAGVKNKLGKPAYKSKFTPSWFSYHYLW